VEVAAFVLSVLAILIAGGSLWYTRRADERATRAEQAGRRARLVVASKGGSYTSGQLAPRQWTFGVRNVGQAAARRVRLWLTDSAQEKVSTEMWTDAQLVLLPGEPEQVGSVEQHAPVEPAELEVWVSYEDDDGPQHERLDVQLT
jgi:hypothetical protein